MVPDPTDAAPAAVGLADRRGRNRPTLADVAALAGVSEATASRVLNGSAPVNGGTRGRVEEAMDRLGYVRRRATHTQEPYGGSVAAIVTESGPRFFSDPYFARLLWGASRTLSAAGHQLTFLAVHDRNEYAAAERYIRSGSIGGVLLVSAHGRDPLLTVLRTAAIPTVACGRPLKPCSARYVDVDNAGGARAAVEHLVHCGRRRVATISGPMDMSSGIDRFAGYRDVVQAAGLPEVVGHGDYSQHSGEHAMTRLLERRPDLDAVFAASDLMAAGALRALRRAGRRVPEDVAVVGFDDDPIARHTLPPLTTVRQPVEEQGATMARRVMALVEHRAVPSVEDNLPTSLVRRESA